MRNPILVGYARVSTEDDASNDERDTLKKIGCERIFTDVAGGASAPGLAEALEHVRPGDTLVVCRLERLGGSLRDLVESIHALHERNVGFRSLHEALETTTDGGRIVARVFAALVEFERARIRARFAPED